MSSNSSLPAGWIRILFVSALFFVIVSATVSAESGNWRKRPGAGETVTQDDVAAEVVFGREVAARILGRYKLLENERVTKYLNLVGSVLAQNTNRPELEYRFALLETDEINAYAAPGGYVFITKGALALVRDEAELAGILAHELSHIAEKHVVKELDLKAADDSAVSGIARLVGGTSDSARLALSQAVDKALDRLFSDGYKREDETQADRDAVIIAATAGYDPEGLARYLERLRSLKKKETAILDKTHPPYEERVAAVKKTISDEGIEPATLDTNRERFNKYAAFLK